MTTTQEPLHISGNISVHTGNILPIIKKWLYSEQDIFLRELTANAHDAILKRQKLSNKENMDCPTGIINLTINEAEKTLTISDNGLGMDAEEIQKYINQIAFSGAEEFVKKFEEKADAGNIIGNFGLGFYSAFMAADTVEIETLSYKAGAQAIRWSCDGSTSFEITSSTKTDVGTDIILHVNTDSEKYLKADLLENLVKKFNNFLPVEIQVEGKKINDQNPLWIKQPNEVTDEEYKAFYQTLFPYSPEPLFWIHLNVDYPFNLKGILYFPQLKNEMDLNKGAVKLFCKQVFVTDNSKEILPEFLSLLKGAIDCADMPLNVSRSYLQQDAYVQKISKHIVKKIAEKLHSLFKNNREDYEKYWSDIHPFIKYGMMQDNEFYEKTKDSMLFETTQNTKLTQQEYLEKNKETHPQTVIYTYDKETQAAYISLFEKEETDVVILNHYIDTHFIQFLESKDSSIKYKSIETVLSEHTEESKNTLDTDLLNSLFKEALKNDALKVEVKALKNDDVPAMIVEAEFSKRMKAMSAMMRNDFAFPTDETVIVNEKNPLIQKIETLAKADKKEDALLLAHHIHDLALLSQKPLTGEQLQGFLHRSHQLLNKVQ